MRRWLSRWRVALRIARRDAGRHRGRTALVVAMIALPILAGTVALTAIRSVTPTPEQQIATRLGPGGQAEVTPAGCRPYYQDPSGVSGGCEDGASSPIDAAALRAVLGVEEVVTISDVDVVLVGPDGAVPDRAVTETQDPDHLHEIVEVVDGRAPDVPGEVALTRGIAARLGVTIGDTLALEGASGEAEAVVVGLVHPASSTPAFAVTGTAPGDDVEEPTRWLVVGEAVTWDQVLLANTQGWEVFSRQVVLDPPPLSATPYGEQFGGIDDGTAMRTAGLVGAVLAMGLLEIVLLVGPAFAVGAKRNARQLALTAAAGGAPADLRRVVLATGVVAAGLAALLGIGLGLVLSIAGRAVLNAVVDEGYLFLVLPTWELAALAVVALLLGLAAAWLPARSVSRQDVAAALAGRRSDPRPTRGIGWLGAGLGVLGMLGMVLAALAAVPAGLVASVLTLEIGVVMMSGVVVLAVGRLAPRLGVAGRFALRDSVRHRSRTAPAVAAVIAAVAAASAGAIYLNGESTASRASWQSMSTDPGLLLRYDGPVGDGDVPVAEALGVISGEVETEAAITLYAGATAATDTEDAVAHSFDAGVYALPDDELSCPELDDSADPRCDSGPGMPTSGHGWPSAFVDDGSLMAASGLPGWNEAAQALAEGGVVVPASSVWADGDARVVVHRTESSDAPEEVVIGPAHGTSWWVMPLDVVLSPEAATELGLEAVAVGGLVTTTSEVPQAEIDRLNLLVREVSTDLTVQADRAREETVPVSVVLVAVAVLVALIAVGLAVGLAGADTAPDLATLAAVGAPPKIRRRVASAQAGVIAGTGGVLGVLTGIPIGLVLSIWGRDTNGYGELWPLTVPWPVPLAAVVVPLVAMGCAWLLTRSRLPLVRRLAA